MKHRVASSLLVALVACGGGSGDDYMVVSPGSGGHPGGEGMIDAPLVDTDGSVGSDVVVGQVCLGSDSRQLTGCQGTGAGGFTVTLGSATAITADDGSFTIADTTAAGALWDVTGSGSNGGSGICESVMRRSDGTQIPVISQTLYGLMSAGTGGAKLGNGEGALIVRLREAGQAAAGFDITSGSAESDVYFDSDDDLQWSNDRTTGTGPFGVAWIPVEPAGSIGFTANHASGQGAVTQVPGIPIVDQAITFVTVAVP